MSLLSKLIAMLPHFALQSDHDAQIARSTKPRAADNPPAEPIALRRLVAELLEARRQASAARTAIAAFEASQQSILAILAGIDRRLDVTTLEPGSHVCGCAGADRAQPLTKTQEAQKGAV
jgi:hypothetical protein